MHTRMSAMKTGSGSDQVNVICGSSSAYLIPTKGYYLVGSGIAQSVRGMGSDTTWPMMKPRKT